MLLPDMLDNHFVSYLEYKNSDIKFKRVDSFIGDNLKDNKESEESVKNKITEIFKDILDKDTKIEVSPLKSEDVSALFVLCLLYTSNRYKKRAYLHAFRKL